MNLNIVIHRLVANKFGWNESSVSRDNEEFIVTSATGEILTNKDFSKEEIETTKKEIEAEIIAEIQQLEEQKNRILDKLGITKEEAQILLS